jgi:hypothetical protein
LNSLKIIILNEHSLSLHSFDNLLYFIFIVRVVVPNKSQDLFV